LECAIIIPTYNRRDGLLRTLSSLDTWCRNGQATVYVCDDGSDDGTEQLVRGRPDIVYLSQTHRGYGVGRARNLGLRAATKARVFLLLDCGMTALPGWLEGHLSLINNGVDVSVGYIYGNGLPADAPVGDADLSFTSIEWRDMREQWYFRDFARLRAAGLQWLGAWLGNSGISRRAFEAIGGFDERLDTWGFEDQEWAFRATEAGMVCEVNSMAKAVHWPHPPSPRAADSGQTNVRKALSWLRHWKIELLTLKRESYLPTVEAVSDVLRHASSPVSSEGHGRWAIIGPRCTEAVAHHMRQPSLCFDPCSKVNTAVVPMLGLCVPFVSDRTFDEVVVCDSVRQFPSELVDRIWAEAKRMGVRARWCDA
jgi:GT2 family glycosyltransferase